MFKKKKKQKKKGIADRNLSENRIKARNGNLDPGLPQPLILSPSKKRGGGKRGDNSEITQKEQESPE